MDKPKMSLEHAKALLAVVRRYDLVDRAFGDSETCWRTGECEVAAGYTGSIGTAVTVNRGEQYAETVFEGEEAKMLMKLGKFGGYSRNDAGPSPGVYDDETEDIDFDSYEIWQGEFHYHRARP